MDGAYASTELQSRARVLMTGLSFQHCLVAQLAVQQKPQASALLHTSNHRWVIAWFESCKRFGGSEVVVDGIVDGAYASTELQSRARVLMTGLSFQHGLVAQLAVHLESQASALHTSSHCWGTARLESCKRFGGSEVLVDGAYASSSGSSTELRSRARALMTGRREVVWLMSGLRSKA